MKKIAKLKKLEKKLTVRTLSFIMAVGLLMLIVPFIALASDGESPDADAAGDFSLYSGFFTISQFNITDEQDSLTVTAEEIDGASYLWQVYTRNREGSRTSRAAGR